MVKIRQPLRSYGEQTKKNNTHRTHVMRGSHASCAFTRSLPPQCPYDVIVCDLFAPVEKYTKVDRSHPIDGGGGGGMGQMMHM